MSMLVDTALALRAENYSSHSYILEESADSGNTLRFAEALCCESQDVPCGRCLSCQAVLNRTYIDLVVMTEAGKSGPTVKDADEFSRRLSMNPYGDFHIGVIEHGEKLSVIVQNKLLKLIEEPPPATIIIIGTKSLGALLPTIRSRCLLVKDDVAKAVGEIQDKSEDTFLHCQNFYELRFSLKRESLSPPEASSYISRLLDQIRVSDFSPEFKVLAITEIERARTDIMQGMNPSMALKRSWLIINNI